MDSLFTKDLLSAEANKLCHRSLIGTPNGTNVSRYTNTGGYENQACPTGKK
jgi:hypothetical protein